MLHESLNTKSTTSTHARKHIHTSTHTYPRRHTRTYTCSHTLTYTRTHLHTHARTHVHTHARTHSNVHALAHYRVLSVGPNPVLTQHNKCQTMLPHQGNGLSEDKDTRARNKTLSKLNLQITTRYPAPCLQATQNPLW